VRRVLHDSGYRVPARLAVLSRLDAVVLNPIAGPALLATVLFLMFQRCSAGPKRRRTFINSGVQGMNTWLSGVLPRDRCAACCSTAWSPHGSVLVFLPQILILFLFILALEIPATCRAPRSCSIVSWDGWASRAARSFRCCRACVRHSGIMAARTIPSARDRSRPS